MKKLLLGLATALFLVSCGGGNKDTLKVGATPVPHTEMLNLVKEDLKKDGVELEIVTFNDYVSPNKSLADKSIDAHFLLTIPYMESVAKKENIDMLSVGGIHIEPMAVYSKKIKNISEIKDGDTVLIPNEATNMGRALLLLDRAGVIKLKDNNNLNSVLEDIVENPKNIKFVGLAAEQIAPRLEEVPAAIINNNYALDAKLTLKDDAILIEDKNSAYVNAVTVMRDRKDDAKIQKLVKALQSSEAVKNYIKEKNLVQAF